MLGSLTLRNSKNHTDKTPALAIRGTIIAKPYTCFTECKVLTNVFFHVTSQKAH